MCSPTAAKNVTLEEVKTEPLRGENKKELQTKAIVASKSKETD